MKKLAAILDEPEHEVAKLILRLESMNGYPSHDVRLIASNIQKIRLKLQQLGLDPDDTTGEELYGALLAKFDMDSAIFDQHHLKAGATFDDRLAVAAKIASAYSLLPQNWVLKKSAAKALLRQQPPRHVMKYLNYRSAESLLKRENIMEVFLAAKLLESKTWQANLKKMVSKLDQTCFEFIATKIIVLETDRWCEVENQQDLIVQSPEVGAVAVWPDDIARQASLLSLVMLYADRFGLKQTDRESVNDDLKAISWWADMDHLVAELAGEHVSLNLRDVAMGSLLRLPYDLRSLKNARQAVWESLAKIYDNLPEIDGKFTNPGLINKSANSFTGPVPAYEFVEDF